MSSKKSDILLSLVLDIIPVAIGVILALLVSQWNETRQEREEVRTLLQAVKQEIHVNLPRIRRTLEYHRTLLDSLGGDRPESVRMALQLTNPDAYAWELTRDYQLSPHVEQELILLLSETYRIQTDLREANASAGNLMNTINLYYGTLMAFDMDKHLNEERIGETKLGWVPILQDLTYHEHRLVENYEKILGMLE